MYGLYNIGIYFYSLIILVVSLWNKKAGLFRRGRKHGYKQWEIIGQDGAPVAWFHCSSLGEFEQGRPLMEAYRNRFPAHKILLTFFSPSGYEIRKNYTGADWVLYLPLDTPRNARRFVTTVKPKIVIFIKYDFWHNLLHALKKQAIPVYVASAIFRPPQAFFQWYGGFFRKMLHAYRYLFVQNEASKELLASIGITNVFVTGDTRFDRVWQLAQTPEKLPVIENFSAGQPTIIAGSTWLADEEKLAAAFAVLPANTKLVIVPHEIHEEHLAAIAKYFAPFGVTRYSMGRGARDTGDSLVHRVLVLDTIGMLSSVYRYGTVAYIGGGFGAGIHNTLEAAVYGIPVVFGPNYQRFREAGDLISQGGAACYTTGKELAGILQKWLAGNHAGNTNRQYVAQHCGATEAILKLLQG
ncbi:MAG: 3-deoxy-D-manno-octulosonic acid transferase [Prevotellaceae bacterium]|jgi:3-deoxy-D-manno-octulosonic-acid transferase|nr:3-deoxy-D-manno-octulosonic acid transferase [Prevotellaceae bacterium]